MTIGKARASVLAAGIATLSLLVSPAHAGQPLLSDSQLKCSAALAKGGIGFVKGKLKLLQKCRNAELKENGSCTAPETEKVTKLEDKLASTIAKACEGIPIGNYKVMGFPGPCADATPASFTFAELQLCMKTSHTNLVDQMFALEYDATVTSLPDKADQKCQAEIAKQSGAYTLCVLKNVQKCRNDLNKGKELGIPADLCATDYDKASTAIQKCADKLIAGIDAKCTAGQIDALNVCTPDEDNEADASACLILEHGNKTDTTEIAVPADLIDFEYATRGGLCGDNIVNNLNEECDGTDDSACDNQCGTAVDPDGHFACLCKTKARMVVVEHSNADTDNGWNGTSSDGGVVEGGNYLVDLYDCLGGLCNAGPSCSGVPHSPCNVAFDAPSGTSANAICAFLGQGTCRKERTANGPHCFQNIDKKCDLSILNGNDPICNGVGDFCQTSFHGPPVAAFAGGVSVCNVSIFSEDSVGTANINDGTASVKVRQRARTMQGLEISKPCPVCGGFCGISRDRCDDDGDCLASGGGSCITAPICSDGLRKDKACRLTAPFGGLNNFFGVTSVDCPPDPSVQGDLTSGGGLDINANPRTTGTVTLLPSFNCSAPGFSGKTCLGGTSEGRPCTVASECPGGSCSPQCHCSGQAQPNDCNAACVGGGNDMVECVVDSECPGGFCHPGDCREDVFDLDSTQEGICVAGPLDGKCSIHSFQSCDADADCATPSETCPECSGETCVFTNRACFVNSGIIRTGTPRTPNGESGAIYCVPGNNIAINSGAGFPGPGALIQRETMLVTP